MALSSINQEQGLYVLSHGTGKQAGYTCLGFDIAEQWARDILAWLPDDKRPMLDAAPGTAEHYAQYYDVVAAGAAHAGTSRTRCPAHLTPELIGMEGKRVEVILPDGQRSIFKVGKSTGWLPCHLEIKGRSTGGIPVYFPAGSKVRVI